MILDWNFVLYMCLIYSYFSRKHFGYKHFRNIYYKGYSFLFNIFQINIYNFDFKYKLNRRSFEEYLIKFSKKLKEKDRTYNQIQNLTNTSLSTRMLV